MKKITIQDIVLAFMGSIILGLGIGMMTKVGIGTDSLSAVFVGISNMTKLSLGTITAIMNAIMILIALILYPKNVGIATVVFMLVSKWPIDFAQKHMIHSENLLISIVLCTLSIAIIALGSELLIFSNLGANAYDSMTMGIGKRLKHEVNYTYIRYACDGLMLIIALIIGGPIGIGTIICLALIGNFMKIWRIILNKILDLDV